MSKSEKLIAIAGMPLERKAMSEETSLTYDNVREMEEYNPPNSQFQRAVYLRLSLRPKKD